MIPPLADTRCLVDGVIVTEDPDRRICHFEPPAGYQILSGLPKQPRKILNAAFDVANMDEVKGLTEVPGRLKIVNLKFAVRRKPVERLGPSSRNVENSDLP